MDFQAWLLSKSIDCQGIEPDLLDCLRLRFEQDTAKQATRVCRAIERCTQIHDLSFYHHQEVAGRKDADESGMRIPDLSFNHHQLVAGRVDATEPEPAATVLVAPSDCQWPARVYRVPLSQ